MCHAIRFWRTRVGRKTKRDPRQQAATPAAPPPHTGTHRSPPATPHRAVSEHAAHRTRVATQRQAAKPEAGGGSKVPSLPKSPMQQRLSRTGRKDPRRLCTRRGHRTSHTSLTPTLYTCPTVKLACDAPRAVELVLERSLMARGLSAIRCLSASQPPLLVAHSVDECLPCVRVAQAGGVSDNSLWSAGSVDS